VQPILVRSKVDLIEKLDAAPAGQPLFQTPPEGLRLLGAAAWAEMARQVRAVRPDRPFRLVVDAGDSPGAALAALNAGCEAVRFTGPRTVAVKLADVAAAKGALLLSDAAGQDRPGPGTPSPVSNG